MARAITALTPRAQQWAELSAQWERSGVSMREFCARRGVRQTTFAWWRHQLAQRQRQAAPPVELVEVARVAPRAEAVVEVVFPNGIQVRVPAGVERQALQEVLTLVRAC